MKSNHSQIDPSRASLAALFAPERSILLGMVAGASALPVWHSASASSQIAGARAASGGARRDVSELHALTAVYEDIIAPLSED